MGLTQSSGVKYGDNCYDIVNSFDFARVYLYISVAFLALASILLIVSSDTSWWISPLVVGIIFLIIYLISVYRRKKKIDDAKQIECKDSFPKYSIW